MATEFQRALRSVPCPHCGAEIGDPCRTPSGRATLGHGARDSVIRNAFFVGIEAGLSDALELGTADRISRQLAFMQGRNRREEQQR